MNAAIKKILRNPVGLFSIIIISIYTIVAVYGECVYRYNKIKDQTPSYQETNLDNIYHSPSYKPGDNFLGTDGLGRSVFPRIIQGTRIAFHVGIITSLIAIPIGVLLGCLGGYYGGKMDAIIVWLYSSVSAMPGLLFILAISMVVGKGLLGIYVGIGFTTWVGVCRYIRAEVIKHKNRQYVKAARALGYSDTRILFRHILPNISHIIIIVFSIRFPAAIATEVFISFIGIGVENEPSWGVMIANARTRLWEGIWWEMTFVTIAIFLIILAFNLLGDLLRDIFDPRLN
ncbi:MAG: ABC transporter permease [Kiritimatiellae bacterium]|jgi:ABC-type dipeptide/oligopeptide/nickel transport system permease subunit|nr:ABC transporter permease [Kiritimatiellia bacterium]